MGCGVDIPLWTSSGIIFPMLSVQCKVQNYEFREQQSSISTTMLITTNVALSFNTYRLPLEFDLYEMLIITLCPVDTIQILACLQHLQTRSMECIYTLPLSTPVQDGNFPIGLCAEGQLGCFSKFLRSLRSYLFRQPYVLSFRHVLFYIHAGS